MATQTGQGEPYELGSTRLIFTDYRYIRPAGAAWYDLAGNNVTVKGDQDVWGAHFRPKERPYGIRIAAEPETRRRLYMLNAEKPWEPAALPLGNVQYDPEDGYYKTWSECPIDGKRVSCYLQSSDFENWERPELGLVEYAGNKANNLLLTGGEFANENYSIFKDPSSEHERWKWIKEAHLTREEYETFCRKHPDDWDAKSNRIDVPYETHEGNIILGIKGGVSPDGLRWTPIAEPLAVMHSDTIVTAYYDAKRRKYVAYVREWMNEDRSDRTGPDNQSIWLNGRRAIGRTESADFRHFPLSEMIMEPHPGIMGPSDTLYTNCHTFIPGAPEQHLFFPTIWHQHNDTTSVAVVSSRDGKTLNWLPGNPVLGTSRFMQWDGGCLFARPQLMELPGGDWVLPFQAGNLPHKYPRRGGVMKSATGLSVWERGRLIAVEAQELGQFTTMAFLPPGRTVTINAVTLRGGSIRVEVADASGDAVPGRSFEDCEPIIGDQYRRTLVWNGCTDIGVPDGQAILLRVRLDQAKLYFFDFESGGRG